MITTIDYEKCTHCKICYEVCPTDCFGLMGRMVFISYPRDCMSCMLCEMDCPEDCIFVSPWRAREPIKPYPVIADGAAS